MGDITTTSDRPNRVAPERLVPYESTVDKETYQAHAMIGGISCSMGDRKRIPLLILNNILGGPGMNSRLNLSLRERHGLVYNVESNLNFYSDTGLASIYFGTDPKNLNKALTLVEKELKKVRNEKLTTSQLSAAIKQLEGQLGVATDNKEGVFLGLGKVMLYFGKYESLSETFAKLESVTAEDILEVANEVYAPENLFRLIYK
jgi:predicted Zn-dependent peptidase